MPKMNLAAEEGMCIFLNSAPAWRNWQTRRTQNPVSSKDVSVRTRPPVFFILMQPKGCGTNLEYDEIELQFLPIECVFLPKKEGIDRFPSQSLIAEYFTSQS